jgi:integrase
LIDRHLVPALGHRDLRELGDADVAALAGAIARAGRSAATFTNAVVILRRVCRLAVEAGLLARNPIPGAGRIARQVARQAPGGIRTVDSWTREEAANLLAVAREREPAVYPVLLCLLSTGMRRGEVLGLCWSDVDFGAHRIWVRRASVRGRLGVPKSGRARTVEMPPALEADLRERSSVRALEPAERVYLSPEGLPWQERNFHRSWARVRRIAAGRHKVRALPLHCARHTVATLHLEAGLSVRWVAEQLGHADPAITLRTYAHALRGVERNLGHVDWLLAAPHQPATATPRQQTATRQRPRRARRNQITVL